MIEAKQFLIQLKGKTKNVVLKISQLRMVKQKMNDFAPQIEMEIERSGGGVFNCYF